MCSNCLTTTPPVECVCCSWSSLNASPYPGATVCIISVSCNIAEQNKIIIKKMHFSLILQINLVKYHIHKKSAEI